MSDLTTYGATQALAAIMPTGNYYVSLHSADGGVAGSSNELAVANGYAREQAAFTNNGVTADNDAIITFSTTADQGTVTHAGVWDASTGGNCLFSSALDNSRAWSSGDLNVAAGAIVNSMTVRTAS